MTVREIAALVGGEAIGDANVAITRVAEIENASAGDITFLANPKYAKFAATTGASALLISVKEKLPDLSSRTSPLAIVRVANVYLAWANIIERLIPFEHSVSIGIHPSAVVAKTATIGKNVRIGENVSIGDGCSIADGAIIYPCTVLSKGVSVGPGTCLYANVTVREACRIGANVIIHSGAVIGSDGFGFAPKPGGGYHKIPQRGIVVIEDDVEVGSNTTIDRATIGETRIKRGAKLDNLIQIAHNVEIGEDSAIAAQSGISGSTTLGKQCVVAGQVGIIGHLEIPDKTTFLARSGVGKVLPDPGHTYFGTPAKEVREGQRIEGAMRQLPELLEELRDLRRRVDELELELKKRTIS